MSSEAYNARERRVDEIIEALSADVWSSMRKCAHHFNISRFTLQDRWNEKASKFIRESINKRLKTAQERATKNYIIRINEKNMLLMLRLVKKVVNYTVLCEANLNVALVEILWTKRFLKRNFEFKIRRQQSIAVHKKDANSISTLKQYFYQLKNVMNQYDI